MKWQAVYEVTESSGTQDIDSVTFEIVSLNDPSGNALGASANNTATTDTSKVRIDLSAPRVSSLNVFSENQGVDLDRADTLLVREGEKLTLTFETSERISGFSVSDNSVYAPRVILTGSDGLNRAATVTSLDDEGKSWQAVYQVGAIEVSGATSGNGIAGSEDANGDYTLTGLARNGKPTYRNEKQWELYYLSLIHI